MDRVFLSEDFDVLSQNGFLFLKEQKGISFDDEEPLLLHTTRGLLRSLYPSVSLKKIIELSGFMGYSENWTVGGSMDASKSKEAESGHIANVNNKAEENLSSKIGHERAIMMAHIESESYQNLKCIQSLSLHIHSTLQDIQHYRHRNVNGTPKPTVVENTQRRTQNTSNAKVDEIPKKKDANKAPVDANGMLKFVRTINSVRALFPHLVPILNHPMRCDKNLKIGSTCYENRKKGGMCWLLGTHGFGQCTSKQYSRAYEGAIHVLFLFLKENIASKIMKDPTGSPSFWMSSWLKHLIERIKPELISPLKVLSYKTSKCELEIEEEANHCDKLISTLYQCSAKNIHQQYQKAVRKVHQRLSNVLAVRFEGARLSLYGSCLSNLSLGKGSDVDMSLWIPAAGLLKNKFEEETIPAWEYEASMRELVYDVNRKLQNLKAEFRNMTPITGARIPVINGTYIYARNPFTEDGSIEFDICLLNDIAVSNSELLREYSLVDSRVKTLMITVKQWAKDQRINSAKEKCLSSYAWMNLVIFYLQCINFISNLQSPVLMKAAGVRPEPEKNYWHSVNRLNTCTLDYETVREAEVWTMPDEFKKTPTSLLLYGFFEFYNSRFPVGTHAVSIRRGDLSLLSVSSRKVSLFISIEDPFETYDSHCPHDLSAPLDMHGSRRIKDCFRYAEDYLGMILCSGRRMTNTLWPEAPFLEPEPRRATRKKARKKSDLPFFVPKTIANFAHCHPVRQTGDFKSKYHLSKDGTHIAPGQTKQYRHRRKTRGHKTKKFPTS